jgi:hypothetical protein
LGCVTDSVVVLPSLEAISLPLESARVRISSLAFSLPLAGVQVMLKANVAVYNDATG